MTEHVLPTPSTAVDRSNLVVISATRNEQRSVALVLAEMARARDELDTLGFRLELLVVDDSDTPETAEELASEAKLRDLRLTVIKGPGPRHRRRLRRRVRVRAPRAVAGAHGHDGLRRAARRDAAPVARAGEAGW